MKKSFITVGTMTELWNDATNFMELDERTEQHKGGGIQLF